jgi:hypothetical protein
MKPDTSPQAATPAEAQWVEAELVRSLMRTARNSQVIGLLLVPIFIGVLYDDASVQTLALWTAAALSVASVRFWIVGK